MKTKVILYLLGVLLLSSCAGKFSVMKRRYNKGFYVARVSSDQKVKHRESETKTEISGNPGFVTKKQTVLNGITSETSRYIPLAKTVDQHPAKRQDRLPGLKISANAGSVENSSQPDIHPAVRPLPAETGVISTPLQDDDTMKILLVILAIFIPPLAVYLKDNAVSKWFWITLILALLGIFGFWFFFYTGFFWLAAVVIAILYVLDLIG